VWVRRYTRRTVHTSCIKLTRLLGRAEFLPIRALAWPN